MTASQSPSVLLTGASGYIALHVLQQLLDANYRVIAIVRNEKRAVDVRRVAQAHADNVVVEFVEDISAPHAYDAVLKNHPEIEYVVHTASPVYLQGQISNEQMVNTAIAGTVSLLEGVHAYNPRVKRVVVTSSVVAQRDVTVPVEPHATVIDEQTWLGINREDIVADASWAIQAYSLSKKLAEQEAWKYVSDNNTRFSLTTVMPSFVFGPLLSAPQTAAELNETSGYFVALANGYIPQSKLESMVDVRDVAHAHVDALTNDNAPGKRWSLVSEPYAVKEIVEAAGIAKVDQTVDSQYEIEHNRHVIDNSKTLSELSFALRPKKQIISEFIADLKNRSFL